jgi:hypothetical protein
MRRFAVLLLLAFAANLTFAQSKDSDTDKKLIENEKKLWQGWQDKKGGPFRDMLTKDSVNVNPMGIDRGAENPKVDWLDKNTALMTYHAVQDATCGGQKIPDAVWATSIWVKQKDKWMAAFHQETPDMSKMEQKP